jgi:hypothetical protein
MAERNGQKVIKGEVTRITLVVKEKWGRNDLDSLDVALLEVMEGFRWGDFTEIQLDPDMAVGDRVDVVGYPVYNQEWFLDHHPSLANPEDSYRSSALLLIPPWHLVSSAGKLLSIGDKPSYSVSTGSGMSGGATVYKGKVIGKLLLML